MADYNSETRKYAMTIGLTTGFLWLAGGLLGTYFSKDFPLFASAALIGGLPIITTFIASKFNILGSLLLIIEAVTVLFLSFAEGTNLIIVTALSISYSLPLVICGFTFISYWYKNKTRI